MDYLQYQNIYLYLLGYFYSVLNLIINGLPSIFLKFTLLYICSFGFKPYYKWITFNIKRKRRN